MDDMTSALDIAKKLVNADEYTIAIALLEAQQRALRDFAIHAGIDTTEVR